MNIAASINSAPILIERAEPSSPILAVTGHDTISIKAGTIVTIGDRRHAFDTETPVGVPHFVAGQDYAVRMDVDGQPIAVDIGLEAGSDGVSFAGFHYAPGGNATARAGGDDMPAINPCSCWDAGFRPACPDIRGMALVGISGGKRFWADIYLLGRGDHLANGTSRFDVIIADGRDLPSRLDGDGRFDKLDYAAARAIYAHHGKQLLGAEEFFAVAYGVTERAARGKDPKLTGDVANGAARFTSKWGLFDATGSMWQWGTDGDPDDPRPAVFGGSWWNVGHAGSRCAALDFWAGYSNENISARGRSDHLEA
ncbi:MAG: hypothetical protein BGN87_00335 [Rhizobiales bacterium 65-79]|nr:hypothetical protein [Hyphomicrobiales bacterium]OJU02630.1 MAG: hypothetical protein BGN87_00335 [Rhizobiales bacterium 65-79]